MSLPTLGNDLPISMFMTGHFVTPGIKFTTRSACSPETHRGTQAKDLILCRIYRRIRELKD
jgi:hypothetical protein